MSRDRGVVGRRAETGLWLLGAVVVGALLIFGSHGVALGAGQGSQVHVFIGGSGRVTSSPAGIDCGHGGSCDAAFPDGTAVTLTAVPDPGQTLQSVMGDCDASPCTLHLPGPIGDETVQFVFSGPGQNGDNTDTTADAPQVTTKPETTTTSAVTTQAAATTTVATVPPPPPGTAVTFAPLARQSLKAQRNRLRLGVTCAGGCKVAVSGAFRIAGKAYKVTGVTRTLLPGVATTVGLGLPKATRTAVARRATKSKPLTASLRIVVTRPGVKDSLVRTASLKVTP